MPEYESHKGLSFAERMERVEATLATWVEDPQVRLDTAVTVLSALVAYHLLNDVALSTAIGMGTGIFIPPAVRSIKNRSDAKVARNGQYAGREKERTFVTKLASVLRTGKVSDVNLSDTVPIVRAPRKE